MHESHQTLCLYNANIITMNPLFPKASWLIMDRQFITKTGLGSPPFEDLSKKTVYIDCFGNTVLPGFNDSHTHILSSAAHELAVDCSPSSVKSIGDIKNKLLSYSNGLTKGDWIRATGYDEFYLEDARHPNRWDLDDAVPDYPVKLVHRSGHAMVLNSAAMHRVGITGITVDPDGGVIERQDMTGDPTGLLFDMNGYVNRIIPELSEEDLTRGLERFNELCLSFGLTSLQDASINNDLAKMKLLKDFKENGILVPSINFMIGMDHLEGFVKSGIKFGDESGGFIIGSAKVVLNFSTGVLHPNREELRKFIRYANRNGFQVAIHAVENRSIEEAINAFEFALNCEDNKHFRNRIEHCSECTPNLIGRIIKNKISVSTQPGFLYYNGQRYLSEVDKEYVDHIYPIRSLMKSGVTLAYGSDSPVINMDPMVGISAAVNRVSQFGEKLQSEERVSVLDAVKSYTVDSAYISWQEKIRGSIEKGKTGDIILLDRNILDVESEDIINVRVLMTIIAGRVVWCNRERFDI
jgi:predicted amidohydrolase YtcJ